MNQLKGALGWVALVAVIATAGACDDPKQLCHDVANKYDECAPKIIEDSLKAVPESFRTAVDMAKEEHAKKLQTTVEDLRGQCNGGKFTDAEKKQFRIWRACVKKDCAEFTKCIAGKK